MLKFSQRGATVFIPGKIKPDEALRRTTHLAIGAHPDDLEIMALDGILSCYLKKDQWFSGVVVTDGAGSPRKGIYSAYTDREMRAIRRREQEKAAEVGEYSCVVFMDFSSAAVKDPMNPKPVRDLEMLLALTRPDVVYTHNLTDKHPTHVAVALRLIQAIRNISKSKRPWKLFGCEVWRDLDWMVDSDKKVFRMDSHESLGMSLMGLYDSQIAGGKRYDLATIGRRRAHATYHESHATDAAQMVGFAMNMSPLIRNDSLDPVKYALGHIDRFKQEVNETLRKVHHHR